METAFVKYLIDTFKSFKEELSVFSQIMENWVRWYSPPYLPFMIEGLSEASVRTQPNLSLEYWGQSDIASVSGVIEGNGVDASDPCH